MELIGKANLSPSGAGTVEQEFSIPAGFRLWSLHVVPKNDAASPGPVTLEIEYKVADQGFFTRDPPGVPTTLALNKDSVVTSEDAVDRIKVKITTGATVPDEGIKLALYGAR